MQCRIVLCDSCGGVFRMRIARHAEMVSDFLRRAVSERMIVPLAIDELLQTQRPLIAIEAPKLAS